MAYHLRQDDTIEPEEGGWSLDLGERADEDDEDGLQTEQGKPEWTQFPDRNKLKCSLVFKGLKTMRRYITLTYQKP
jgi:hypothetical protein